MLTLTWDNPILPGFVVFEGLDGAGTTTQAHRLVTCLRSRGVAAEFTCEPTDYLTGRTIRALLTGPERATPWTLAMLFAADRHEHLERPESGILARLATGATVISDRYLFSSIAYQGAFCDGAAVERLNGAFPLPEHLVFVDTPQDEASRRLAHRGLGRLEPSGQRCRRRSAHSSSPKSVKAMSFGVPPESLGVPLTWISFSAIQAHSGPSQVLLFMREVLRLSSHIGFSEAAYN